MRKRVVKIGIPAGVHEGQAVRIGGEGEPGHDGGPAGDLHCYIARGAASGLQAVTTATWCCQIPISFTQGDVGRADRGADIEGDARHWTSPAGTQHGEVFKLKGKGLPDPAQAATWEMS